MGAGKTIPIVSKEVDLKFFPESGCLVAGVPNVVYFEALSPNGEPLDLEGDVIHDTLGIAAHLYTAHEGRGRFEFVPNATASNDNSGYCVRISSPSSLAAHKYQLPSVQDHGAVVHSQQDVYAVDEVPHFALCIIRSHWL